MKVIDLSLRLNQHLLSNALKTYFTEHELYKMDFKDLYDLHSYNIQSKLSFRNEDDDKENNDIVYYMEYKKHHSILQITNGIDAETFPPDKIMIITMSKGTNYRTDVYCTLNDKNPIYLSICTANAMNDLNYHDATNKEYGRKEYRDNFAKVVATLVKDDDESIEYFMSELKYVDEDKLLEKGDTSYKFIRDHADLRFKVTNARLGVIKMIIKKDDKAIYLYLPKTDAGIASVSLILYEVLMKMHQYSSLG